MIAVIYLAAVVVFAVFSYGYIDPHLSSRFGYVAFYHRPEATIVFLAVLIAMFAAYLYFLKHTPKLWVIVATVAILIFSYPALTYDMFNYATTAKVLYHYGENPYIVMPIEIAHEPYLAFTRAANKVALYGPAWLAITAIPYYLGAGNIWATLLVYKIMNAAEYGLFCYIVWKMTKNVKNVLFFALNPLVLLEVIANGHNDIYMMLLALGGLALWQNGKKIKGLLLLAASWFIKGATAPLVLVMNKSLVWAYWLLAAVSFILGSIREEPYPWYAVWLVTTCALLPMHKHRNLFIFTGVVTFALELRNLPYLWMGYYEGPGPMLRTLLTVVPVGIWLVWSRIKRV